MFKYLPHLLKGHVTRFREAEVDEDTPDNAQSSVETKRPTRTNPPHHPQECATNNNIRAPIEHIDHRGAHSPDLHRQELIRLPGHTAQAHGIEAHEPNHHDQYKVSGPADLGRCDG